MIASDQHADTADAPSPLDPFGFGAAATAWSEEFQRQAARMAALPRALEMAREAPRGVSPYDVIHREEPVRLLRFRSTAEHRHTTPLLCVFALVNRPYVLDLLEHKSVVRRFLDDGFDVYMVDWGVPRPADHVKTLTDYVEGHLHRIVKQVLATSGQDQLSLLGYCMGGTMSLMYTARHQELVRNLMLMAAPCDWSHREHMLGCWVSEQSFDADAIVDTYGNVPADFLGGSFSLLKPIANARKWTGFLERCDDEKFLADFWAMEAWANDNIPIAGETYRDFVTYGLQQNRLVKGTFPLDGRPVDLSAVTCPVLQLVATADHLVPMEQSTPLAEHVSSRDISVESVKAGHIGLAVSSRAHRELWPKAVGWLGERSGG
jgi:polyhydroxyalkanoate synthase